MKKLFLMLTVLMSACAAQSGSQNTVLPVSKESRTEIDKGWDLYMNPEYQFSMKIPKNIEAKTMSGYVSIGNGMWKIEKKEITSEQLGEFVVSRFGPDCVIEETTPWVPSYVQQVIVGVPPEKDIFGKVKCLPRFSAWAILFDPKINLLVYWDKGQEDRFYGSGSLMKSSFRFID